MHPILPASALACLAALSTWAGEPALKTESFDHDPGWEGFNNRMTATKEAVVKQDFGWRRTHFAGKEAGEIGGEVQRAAIPASYAAELGGKTLDDPLSASGTFAITDSGGNAGVFFGFFNSHQPGGSGRPVGSLGMDIDFEKKGARIAVRLITASNQSCGTFITPFLPGKYRPTPIKKDGTRYHWALSYDPQGAGGNGRFTFSLTGDQHPAPPLDASLPAESQTEARARFPYTTSFSVDVPPAMRKDGATFDRFGLHNNTKPGGTATLYFDDLEYNGQKEDFSRDPGWAAQGNETTYAAGEQGGVHNFGWQASHLAGGSPGEVGGLIWRSPYAYYASKTGPLDLRHKLEASGKVVLEVGAPDSGMMIGWFNSTTRTTHDKDPLKDRDFIGISIGGPTRVGHYFLPFCHTAAGGRATLKKGPVMKQGQAYPWSFRYDPEANNGRGELSATLGAETVTLDLRAGRRPDDAAFDRFGLFTVGTGGGQVKVHFDDLSYTASHP